MEMVRFQILKNKWKVYLKATLSQQAGFLKQTSTARRILSKYASGF
jgi:hypothetical protein